MYWLHYFAAQYCNIKLDDIAIVKAFEYRRTADCHRLGIGEVISISAVLSGLSHDAREAVR